ncbi:SAV_915 family protein [Sciscionella marina]|uniref:SAV_915 family protein n=1 Tax=Sciscionella marina TaxID=508770 RepID=UPI00037D62AD|nr:SAV_915 family protein [Sciscionella marina]
MASRRPTSPDDEVVLELRRIDQGRLAVMAYSSLDALVECCGGQQPWVATTPAELDDWVRRSEADGFLWDAEIPEEHQHGPFGDDVISRKDDEDA